jgi:hypothetical protein
MPYLEQLVTFAGEDVTPQTATQGAVQQFNQWSALNPGAEIVHMSTSVTSFEGRDPHGQSRHAFCYILTILVHTPAEPAA